MTFQLHNRQYTLTTDELSLLLGGVERGAYLGNHQVDYHNFWSLIAPREGRYNVDFVAGTAKASSIRNPVFRYFHRLLATGLLARQDDGTVQANEIHIMWAAWHNIRQSLGCYLMDHFSTQSRAHQKVSVGAMITPIANHFGLQINEPPISTDILLDKKAMKQRHMLYNDPNPRAWSWVIHRASGKYIFPLPHVELTNIMGEDVTDRMFNWRMNAQVHQDLMTMIGDNARRGFDDGGDEEEREEEEEAYEQGGGQPHQEAARGSFHMRAPDFEGFEQRFFAHSDAHYQENMQARDNYYMTNRRFTEEQVGYVRQDLSLVQQDVRDIRTDQRAMMEILNRMNSTWPWYPPQDPPPN